MSNFDEYDDITPIEVCKEVNTKSLEIRSTRGRKLLEVFEIEGNPFFIVAEYDKNTTELTSLRVVKDITKIGIEWRTGTVKLGRTKGTALEKNMKSVILYCYCDISSLNDNIYVYRINSEEEIYIVVHDYICVEDYERKVDILALSIDLKEALREASKKLWFGSDAKLDEYLARYFEERARYLRSS